MRIALVTNEYITEENFDGGLSNYLHRVALSLKKMGHEPIIFVTSQKNELLIHRKIHVYRTNTYSRFFSILDKLTLRKFRILFYLIRQTWKLNRKLNLVHKANPFDIVQYTHLGGIGLFRPKKIPCVIRLSSYLPLSYSMGDGSAGGFLGKQQHFLEQWALKRADKIFCPSKLISEIVSKAISKSVKIIESPFFKETDDLDDTPYKDMLEGKKYLLFFGTLNQLKGILTIAEIIEKLLSKHPNLYFVFIGKEMRQIKSKSMINLVWNKAGKHRGRVIYMGKMPHETLYPILSHATAVVLPSRIENFPNACIEAMAYRRIVIGTHGTSFEQLIINGKNGFLCNVDDADDLLQTIEKAILLSKEEKETISNNASERIAALRPEVTVQQLINFYNQAISEF